MSLRETVSKVTWQSRDNLQRERNIASLPNLDGIASLRPSTSSGLCSQ